MAVLACAAAIGEQAAQLRHGKAPDDRLREERERWDNWGNFINYGNDGCNGGSGAERRDSLFMSACHERRVLQVWRH
jgi:hypothetical protein